MLCRLKRLSVKAFDILTRSVEVFGIKRRLGRRDCGKSIHHYTQSISSSINTGRAGHMLSVITRIYLRAKKY